MTDVAQPTAPPDRPPDVARLNATDEGTAIQQNRAQDSKGRDNGPVSDIEPLSLPQTMVAGDNVIDFGRRVHEYTIVNESGATIRRALDKVATGGSFPIVTGQTLNERKRVRKLHIWCGVAGAVVGGATASITVEGGVL